MEEVFTQLLACGIAAFYVILAVIAIRLAIQAAFKLCHCSMVCFNRREKCCMHTYCREHCWMYCHGFCQRERFRVIK